MKGKVKLANFDDPKWSYDELKKYAQKYRSMMVKQNRKDKWNCLVLYQAQPRSILITNLKEVQKYLY